LPAGPAARLPAAAIPAAPAEATGEPAETALVATRPDPERAAPEPTAPPDDVALSEAMAAALAAFAAAPQAEPVPSEESKAEADSDPAETNFAGSAGPDEAMASADPVPLAGVHAPFCAPPAADKAPEVHFAAGEAGEQAAVDGGSAPAAAVSIGEDPEPWGHAAALANSHAESFDIDGAGAEAEDSTAAAPGDADPDPEPPLADLGDAAAAHDPASSPEPLAASTAGAADVAGDEGIAEGQSADAARLAESLRRARARVIKVRRPGAPPPEDGPAPDAADPVPSEREGRAILQSGPDADADEAVNRLLRQANSELDGVASRRRRSTIAHLKAAVAATVADLRGGSGARSQAARDERYRADLASVVHPAAGDAPAAPDRLEPLVLNASLRVDRAPPPPDGAAPARVQPRRVTAAALDAAALDAAARDAAAAEPADPASPAPAEAPSATARDFAAFADRLGASSMPDLLEAAAAYTVCVEGQPHFTRPHLMRHVADLSDRYLGHQEDEMRGFGELLRQGRIEKLKRGQFVIPETSRMLAEARRLGT
jgi:hypothetical protein